MRTRIALVSLVGVAALLVGCGPDPVVTVTTSAGTTASTTASSEPVETTPVMTEAPTTLPGPLGWSPVDMTGEPGPVGAPCCGANWYGVVSPALPAAGGTIADGSYVLGVSWAGDPTQPLVGEVYRLDQCSVLPQGSCEPADSYADDELGLDPQTIPIEIPLDGSVRVVLVGFAGMDQTAAAQGNGADLAQLAAALDADYQTAILQPLAAGVSKDDIVTGLWASGEHHFGKPNYDWEPAPSELVYTNFGAPPLLFQAAFGFDETPADNRGVDILGVNGLAVQDGRFTIYVYAGWYS